MFVKGINLTSQEILDKEFKTGMRGYNQDEVDDFLDLIIQDYEIFQKEINRLKEEVSRLTAASSGGTGGGAMPRTQVNADVLQRLSNLEKAVFGKRYRD